MAGSNYDRAPSITALAELMNGTVLDILIYVFDRYMFDEAPEVPERDALARDLESAGFGEANVERALDWLADLAGERLRALLLPATDQAAGVQRKQGALRLYTPLELARLSADCRGLLLSLEQVEILSPAQRELVIDRLLALDVDDLNLDQVRWIVLMVLSSQPDQEQACARMETLVFDADTSTAH
jgi:Smg protein